MPFPKICLQAVLPEQIREGATYKLEGEGPKGSFTGETVVPAAARVLDPGDTVWLPDSIRTIRIPIRYRAPPEVGMLRPEMFATFSDSTGTESRWISVSPGALDVDGQTDTLSIYWHYDKKIQQGSLHLLGIGWHYTNFRWLRRTRFPWPNLGVSAEGVYGYFDGSAKSRPIQILVEEGR